MNPAIVDPVAFADAATESRRRKTSVIEALANQDYDREVLKEALQLQFEEQQELWALARARRRIHYPADEVEVRSVVEVSNVCRQACHYCGMAKGNPQPKYLMPHDEFVEVVEHIYAWGRRVLLVQSGENQSQKFVDYAAKCTKTITDKYPDLEVILCLGNLSDAQYRQLKDAGAARYILKFETSDPELYHKLKPTDTLDERIDCLENLVEIGYKVGTGNIVGLPGQTLDSMVDDLLFAGKFDLTMVSATVFIAGEDTHLRGAPTGNLDWTLNTLALMRIMYPHCLIPTTSPLERLRKGGQAQGLLAGANTVTIHDGTPEQVKKLFTIYSTKRFTPNAENLFNSVKTAGLGLAKGSLI
jgi:biotin synthase